MGDGSEPRTAVMAREIREDEIERGLLIRNAIFPPITKADWMRGGPNTGAIAYLGDEPAGFIPLFLRRMRIAPGVVMTGAFENAVGTRGDVRGQGIGSAMIEAARDFMRGRADALMVYRGKERSQGYRFYEKTGHADLCYMREYSGSTEQAAMHPGVSVSEGTVDIIAGSGQMLELFEETYGAFGGYPDRHPAYWEHAFRSPYYAARPQRFFRFQLRERGQLTGYLIAGKEISRDGAATPFRMLEAAAAGADERRIQALLESAFAYCAREGLGPVSWTISDDDPHRALLDRLGLTSGPRSLHTMALACDARSLFAACWLSRLQLPGAEVRVSTPSQDVTLLPARHSEDRVVTLEMKDDTFTRWLMGRIDFRSRVKEGTITVRNGNAAVVEELHRAIPLTPWVYHPIDYC